MILNVALCRFFSGKYNLVIFRAPKIPSDSLDVQTEPEPEKPGEPEPKPEPVKKTWTTAMDHTGRS